jgi:hypothetical protein
VFLWKRLKTSGGQPQHGENASFFRVGAVRGQCLRTAAFSPRPQPITSAMPACTKTYEYESGAVICRRKNNEPLRSVSKVSNEFDVNGIL